MMIVRFSSLSKRELPHPDIKPLRVGRHRARRFVVGLSISIGSLIVPPARQRI
jgi:hypothetical protein